MLEEVEIGPVRELPSQLVPREVMEGKEADPFELYPIQDGGLEEEEMHAQVVKEHVLLLKVKLMLFQGRGHDALTEWKEEMEDRECGSEEVAFEEVADLLQEIFEIISRLITMMETFISYVCAILQNSSSTDREEYWKRELEKIARTDKEWEWYNFFKTTIRVPVIVDDGRERLQEAADHALTHVVPRMKDEIEGYLQILRSFAQGF